MSIPIFRIDNKSLRTLGISPGAYGWLSVAVAWLTRGGWNLPDDDETPYSDMWDMGTMHDADYCDMMDYIRDGKWT